MELNADPLKIVRELPTMSVPIEKIKTRAGIIEDEIFLNKYSGYLKGKYPVYVTRIELDRIRPGFWKSSKGSFEHVCDDVPDVDIAYVKDLIHLGNRPALYIYRNQNKADDFDFVCPDDVAVYRAYSLLGIRMPPVILLGRPELLDEPCIVVRQLKYSKNTYISQAEDIYPLVHKAVPSILGVNKPPFDASLDKLIESLESTKDRVKHFHRGGMVTLHYHHTLYSVLLRAQETLRSIKLLVAHGFHLNASSLVRTLYELTLTFYVDWLAPTQMYRYLQLASVMKESEWKNYCEKTQAEQIKAGLTYNEARRLYDAKVFGFRLASVVSENARLFPLGPEHHKDLYAFLSQITHHDFSMNARYTHTLEHGDESVYYEDAKNTTIYCVDLFTSAIVARILDDVGQTEKMPSCVAEIPNAVSAQ